MTKRLTNETYWENHPVRATIFGVGAVWAVVIVIIILGLLTSLGLWVGGVIFSPIQGRGEAYKQQQSANNRIFAQQHFETLYGDIKAADAKLTTAQNSVKANPGNSYYQTNFDGLQNLCIDDVTQYNQDAHKYLLKEFLTADLPYQINPADPTTDCQP